MATKLYLHRTEITTPATLPSTEQSSLTPDANLFDNEDGSENRLMNTTISVAAQTTLQNTQTGDTNAHNYYVARWVSPQLNQTSVAANTWTVEMGIKEANANANFPRSGAGANRICAYVWKPSNGTKYGNILDGNTAADGEEATTSQTVSTFTFTGAAVSSLTAGDAVIVFELWAIVTQGTATARIVNVYYDGTTEASTTNEAAWISTPETIAFTQFITRSISETIGFSPAVAEAALKLRAISETITFTPAVDKVKTAIVAIGQSIGFAAAVVEEFISGSGTLFPISIPETMTFTPAITSMKTAIRDIPQTIGFSPAVEEAALKLRAISESIGFTPAVEKIKTAIRAIPQTISFSDSISRFKIAIRAIDQSIGFSPAIDRAALKLRSVGQTIGFAASTVREYIPFGGTLFPISISETISFSPAISRMKTAIRDIPQTIGFSPAVEEASLKLRAIAQSIGFSPAVTSIAIKVRAVAQSIGFTPTITTIAVRVRSIDQAIGFTPAVSKAALYIRNVSQTISFSAVVDRLFIGPGGALFEIVINETISFSDSVTSLFTKFVYRVGGKASAGSVFMKAFKKRSKKWHPNWAKMLRKKYGIG